MLNDIREEKNIEADFFRLIKLAQMDEPQMATPSQNKGAGGGLDLGGPDSEAGGLDLDETLDPGEPGGGEDGLPSIDTDEAEMEAVKELIPWDSFVILFDPHYAKLLQDSLQLPEPKAKSKSFYIYFSPENKRVEGIVNKRYVGGYNQKEVLGEDFSFLKSLSAEGFPGDWKEKLLCDIDELPAVENSKVKDELRKKQEDKEEAEEEGGEAEPSLEAPAETPEAPEGEEGAKAKAPTQEVPPPPSVGKVDTKGLASINQFKMRKFARNSKMNKIASSDSSDSWRDFLSDALDYDLKTFKETVTGMNVKILKGMKSAFESQKSLYSESKKLDSKKIDLITKKIDILVGLIP
jgi:hypothetical protein